MSTNTDAEVLAFIHNRMVEFHGENPNYDYMHALARIRDAARAAQDENWVPSQEPITRTRAAQDVAGRESEYQSCQTTHARGTTHYHPLRPRRTSLTERGIAEQEARHAARAAQDVANEAREPLMEAGFTVVRWAEAGPMGCRWCGFGEHDPECAIGRLLTALTTRELCPHGLWMCDRCHGQPVTPPPDALREAREAFLNIIEPAEGYTAVDVLDKLAAYIALRAQGVVQSPELDRLARWMFEHTDAESDPHTCNRECAVEALAALRESGAPS